MRLLLEAATTELTSCDLTTPLGPMLAIASEEGIVLVDFLDRKGMPGAVDRLRTRFDTKHIQAVTSPGDHPHLGLLGLELSEYFSGTLQSFSVPISPFGSDFEQLAWKSLRDIGYGQTQSYGEQARAMGTSAVRAVGRANGMNFLSVVIPCHRVIGSNGSLTGYGGGLARKQWLLDHEREHCGGSTEGSLFDRVN